MPDEKVRKLLEDAARGGAEKVDVLWAFADAAAAAIDGATSLPIAGSLNSLVQGLHGATSSSAVLPNPHFVWNGQDDPPSPKTLEYLKKRGRLQLGGSAVAAAGAIASIGTVADVGALLQHGNATGSTIAHIVKFKAIAKSNRQSQTISGWMDVIFKMKAMKAGLRGGQFAAAVVTPIPWGGSTAVSITAGVLAAGAKLGIKLKFTTVCNMTALELHWRAFQETAILGGLATSRGIKGTGPAGRILGELFVRRGATRILGQHDLSAFVREPCGWKAIADKLLLM
jgi:hypothetical protein